jgi:hypothetical protein
LNRLLKIVRHTRSRHRFAETRVRDRRRKLVTLTAAGHDAIATADAIWLRPPHAIKNLTPDELGQLTGLLARLLEVDAAGSGDGPQVGRPE